LKYVWFIKCIIYYNTTNKYTIKNDERKGSLSKEGERIIKKHKMNNFKVLCFLRKLVDTKKKKKKKNKKKKKKKFKIFMILKKNREKKKKKKKLLSEAKRKKGIMHT